MLNFKSLSTMVATVALCGVVVAPSFAQTRNSQQNRYRYNQRTWQIRSLVDAAERTSNAFRDAVEKRDRNTNSRNRDIGSSRERFFDDLTPAVQRLDEALERLRRVADNNRPRAGRDEMEEVLTRAREVDKYFSGTSFGWGGNNRNGNGNGNNNRYGGNNRNGRYNYTRSSNLDDRWQDLRNDLNALAKAYGLQALSGRRGW